MTKSQQTFLITFCIVAVVICVVLYPFCLAQGISYAAEKSYSNVLDDLKKDTSFDMSYYPDNADDNSLKVITVAESEDDELFVYVYQPSAKTRQLTAVSVDISTTIYDEIAFHNYHLKLLNRQGVFGKYLVEGLTVRREGTRYYAITDILRPWVEGLDDPATGGNTISEVPFEVAKQWEFGELNGKSYVRVVDIDTIVVKDKFCGFVRYPDGFRLFKNGACDSHFVAFDTYKPIDKLLEADVYYTYQEWNRYGSGYMGTGGGYVQSWQDPEFGNKGKKEVTVKSEQRVDYSGGGLFAGSFTWERIETVDEFVWSAEFEQQVYSGAFIDVSLASKLDDSAKENLKKQKWVLRFLETPFEHSETPLIIGGGYSYHEAGTIVGDVKILRLKFVTDGKTYNLGVVDNKQSGDPFDPVNDTNYTIEMAGWIKDAWDIIKKVLLAILIVFVLLVVIWLVSKLVSIFRRPKVVIKDDKNKKHKE